jgi:hypothetical protein
MLDPCYPAQWNFTCKFWYGDTTRSQRVTFMQQMLVFPGKARHLGHSVLSSTIINPCKDKVLLDIESSTAPTLMPQSKQAVDTVYTYTPCVLYTQASKATCI